jgi:integrase
MKRATTMSAKVEQYLEFRRALGFRLKIEGQLLQQFGRFADASGHQGPLTVELALQWAQSAKGCDRLYWARRLEIVRCFARHVAVAEPGTQVPGRRLLGPAHRRTTPHLYTARELAALLTAARRLSPADGLRPHTYVTLLGLLACTGLRISEALHLVQADVDLGRGVLKVRETKFRKTRLVPLHPTAVSALRAYADNRTRLLGVPKSDRFFLSDQGRELPYSTVRHTFRRLCASLGITGEPRRHPRLHDLRHTFACRRVEQWYRSGADLDHAISALSVYLGHAKVTDTYWYLTATPDLMALAAKRFESFVQTQAEEANP